MQINDFWVNVLCIGCTGRLRLTPKTTPLRKDSMSNITNTLKLQLYIERSDHKKRRD